MLVEESVQVGQDWRPPLLVIFNFPPNDPKYLAELLRAQNNEERGTYSHELRKQLEYYEIQTEPRKPIRRLNYQSFRFNAVLRGKLGGEWHWTVWDADRGKLLDPYKPGGRFRCTSFIKVVSRAHSCRKPSATRRFISIGGALP